MRQRSGRGPREVLLARARRRNGRWVGSEFEMAQNLANDRSVGDGGDDAEGALETHGTALQVEGKDAFEQPGPTPTRRGAAALLRPTLLARCRGDRVTQTAMRRSTPTVAD